MTLLENIIEDYNNNTFLKNIERDSMHPQDAHVGVSDEALLERTLKEFRSTTTFHTEYDYENCLLETIIDNISDIEEEMKKINHGERLRYTTVFNDEEWQGEDPVDFETRNKAFVKDKKGKVYEATTNACYAVLQKDRHADYGFRLITFYPDANIDPVKYPDANVKKTNRDLTDLLHENPIYLESPAIEKTYYDLAIQKEETAPLFFIRDHKYPNQSNIRISSKLDEKFDYTAMVKNDYTLYRGNNREPLYDKVQIEKLHRLDPILKNTVEKAEDLKSKYQTEEYKKREKQRRPQETDSFYYEKEEGLEY